VRRVAARNGLPVAQVHDLVEEHTDGRALGFIGEPRVNVLELNIALRTLAAGN
jgi:K+-transporting ATPase ATPase C chain